MEIMRLDEFNENKIVKYRWREPYANVWHTTKCEVLSHNDKTAVIKLLEFGKCGARPGTQLRVHLKSLIGFSKNKPELDDSWKNYTYFD